MLIDRSNYEIWLIDWLDGNLSNLQVEELELFLKRNPDIREEIEEISLVSLKPLTNRFPNKDSLKKSSANLLASQFEYLCIAYLENDLVANQHAELQEIIAMDPNKKREFELIQKTKLSPLNSGYPHKKRLMKRTSVYKMVRFSITGLSIAASVLLLITTYFLVPRNISDNNINRKRSISSMVIPIDTNRIHPPVKRITVTRLFPAEQERKKLVAKNQNKNTAIQKYEISLQGNNDTLLRNIDNGIIPFIKIPVNSLPELKVRNVTNSLIASNITLRAPLYDYERSNLNRFITKTFREKILREDAPADIPLKGYEIAQAGVTGLNKLLGWEMTLITNNDMKGEVKSVYFSSKMLTFNAPVKKSEPLP